MAVVIRLKRTGRSKRPCYRISVLDSRSKRDGATLETLGVYDPVTPKEELRLTLDIERAKHWLSVGATPSDTVNSIFRRQGVYADRTLKASRKRKGRNVMTKTKASRSNDKAGRLEAKAIRRDARVVAKREAAVAAASSEGEE
jgi:small subunit ribosomal protein S16